MIGVASLVLDITDQKRAEEQLRRAHKMDAIGQLTGGIAHDFNNILGIILGNLDLLERHVSDEDKTHQRIETLKKSAQRAADLTRQLLGFSRRKVAQLANIDLRVAVRDMENLITRSVTPEIEVEHQFAEDLWLTEIDPGDFQDALLNLILNARDAMPYGGRLTLEARNCTLDDAFCAQNPGSAPGEYVQLAVSDNGVGIPPELREKVFEPFFTTKPQGKGTGLGLAMVYGFAKRSEGYVSACSEQDIGTTVRLYLPRVEGERHLLEVMAEPSDALPRGRETILVVDDEEELLALARRIGYSSTSGWISYPSLTANVFEEDREKVLAAGCDDFVRKPLKTHIIFEIISKHLGVRYIYDEDSRRSSTVNREVVNDETLSRLSPSLLAELGEAAVELDTERTRQVVQHISKEDSVLEATLEQLVQEFRFEDLHHLATRISRE